MTQQQAAITRLKPEMQVNTGDTHTMKTPAAEITEQELLTEQGCTQAELPRWRAIHADLLLSLQPDGAAEAELVKQAATSILRGADGLQRILGGLGQLKQSRTALW
jgi:hypothetical protein